MEGNGVEHAPERPDVARSPEQASREYAVTKAADALEEIDVTAGRVERYRDEVAKLGGHDDVVAMLTTAAEQLAATRKELRQRLYSGRRSQDRLF